MITPPISRTLTVLLDALRAQVELRYAQGPVDGIFGIRELDELVGADQAGLTTLIVGRAGAGRTTLALQAALHGAAAGSQVVYMTNALPAAEVATRFAAIESGVTLSRLRNGILDDTAWRDLERSTGRRDRDLLVCDGVNNEALLREILREVDTAPTTPAPLTPPKMVVVDGLEHIEPWATNPQAMFDRLVDIADAPANDPTAHHRPACVATLRLPAGSPRRHTALDDHVLDLVNERSAATIIHLDSNADAGTTTARVIRNRNGPTGSVPLVLRSGAPASTLTPRRHTKERSDDIVRRPTGRRDRR